LRDLSKTFLREDLKDLFPHSIVSIDMILSKNSKLDKDKLGGAFKEFTGLDYSTFEGKEFWPLAESYILKDVQIVYRCLLELDRLYVKEIGYSIVDRNCHGLASISYDFVLKFVDKEDLVPLRLVISISTTLYLPK
jgi:hypothetical protein